MRWPSWASRRVSGLPPCDRFAVRDRPRTSSGDPGVILVRRSHTIGDELMKTMKVNMAPPRAPSTERAASGFTIHVESRFLSRPSHSSTQCKARTAKMAITMVTAGQIQIEFQADLPSGGPNRRLTFENRHQSGIAAYQVNCLVPRDPDIRIVAQRRNDSQSIYQLDYVQAGVHSGSSFAWGPVDRVSLCTIALVLLGRLALLWRQRARAENHPRAPAPAHGRR